MDDKLLEEQIKKEIHLKLNQIELTEDLYHLLCDNDIQHTSNKNGIFVNISLLDEVSLMLLYNYINTSDNDKEDKIENEITDFQNIVYEKKEVKKVIKKEVKLKLDSLQDKIISFSLV